jgi:hypothetical protein
LELVQVPIEEGSVLGGADVERIGLRVLPLYPSDLGLAGAAYG